MTFKQSMICIKDLRLFKLLTMNNFDKYTHFKEQREKLGKC